MCKIFQSNHEPHAHDYSSLPHARTILLLCNRSQPNTPAPPPFLPSFRANPCARTTPFSLPIPPHPHHHSPYASSHSLSSQPTILHAHSPL